MVFGFFKAIKEGIMEGLAEAKEELAQEEAMEAMENSTQARELKEKYDALLPEEIFTTLLGAPLRELFLDDGEQAQKNDRIAYYSFSMEVPEKMSAEMAKYLKRDFNVVDFESLLEAVDTIKLVYIQMANALLLTASDEENAKFTALTTLKVKLENIDDEAALLQHFMPLKKEFEQFFVGKDLSAHKSALAVATVRLAYMATVSAGLGYTTKVKAYTLLADLIKLLFPLFSSWQEYAQAYMDGEKEDGANNALGRKFIAKQVNWLLENEKSQWLAKPWPKVLPEYLAGNI